MYKPGKKSVRPHSQHPRAAGGAIQTMLSHQTRHIIGRMQGLILVVSLYTLESTQCLRQPLNEGEELSCV